MNQWEWTPRHNFSNSTLAWYGLYSGMDCMAFLWDDLSKNYWEVVIFETNTRRRFFVNEYPRNTEGMKRVMAEVELMVRLEST